MRDLETALAELISVTEGPAMGQPWVPADFVSDTTGEAFATVVATVLNAVISGDLIPKADADLSVALMVEPLLKLREGIEADIRSAHHGRGNGSSSAMREDDRDFRAAVDAAFDALAPAPASALAELQALRDARTALTGDRATDFDNDAVYQFSKLMKDKMAKSRAKGRKGWNDPTQCSPDFLRQLLYEHIYKGDPVDVANLCMMLRHYDEPTTPKPEDDLRLLHTEAAEAELATLRAQVERLTGALTIAANRLHRCSVDYDTGTREFIEVGGWADEARAALQHKDATHGPE